MIIGVIVQISPEERKNIILQKPSDGSSFAH